MSNEKIISVLCTGRCGSSMISGILHYHGAFVGRCRPPYKHNKKGTFENVRIKPALKARFGFDLLGDFPSYQEGWMEEVYQIFEGDGWESGKALVKTGAFYADVWRDVISLKVYRDLEAILDSYKRSGYLFRYSPEEIRFIMERQLKKMDEIDCPAIYSDEVVKGDYGRLKEAVEHCGYTFDKDLVDSVVDKELYAIN